MPAQIKITKRAIASIECDGTDRFYRDGDLPGGGGTAPADGDADAAGAPVPGVNAVGAGASGRDGGASHVDADIAGGGIIVPAPQSSGSLRRRH